MAWTPIDVPVTGTPITSAWGTAVRDDVYELSLRGTTQTIALTADVFANPVDAWEDVLAVSLVAGTWLVVAEAHVDNGTNVSATEGWLRLYDATGAAVVVDAYVGLMPASGYGFRMSHSLVSPPLVLVATSTIRLQARCHTNADLAVRATVPSAGGTANKATHLTAVRLA